MKEISICTGVSLYWEEKDGFKSWETSISGEVTTQICITALPLFTRAFPATFLWLASPIPTRIFLPFAFS